MTERLFLLRCLRSFILVFPAIFLSAFSLAAEPVDKEVDPWYGFNSKMFAFNEFMDRHLVKPAAKGYDRTVDEHIKSRIRAFFNNMAEPADIANSLLQAEWGQANQLIGRFMVNSTFGLAGFWDVATDRGFGDLDEDFGLTLAKWGVGSGPYLVLPAFGPSTVRDGLGRVPDYLMTPTTYIDDNAGKLFSGALNGVDTRARYLGLEKVIIGDRYTFYRDAWLSQRYLQVTGEEPEDDFILEEDEDWGDDEGW